MSLSVQNTARDNAADDSDDRQQTGANYRAYQLATRTTFTLQSIYTHRYTANIFRIQLCECALENLMQLQIFYCGCNISVHAHKGGLAHQAGPGYNRADQPHEQRRN